MGRRSASIFPRLSEEKRGRAEREDRSGLKNWALCTEKSLSLPISLTLGYPGIASHCAHGLRSQGPFRVLDLNCALPPTLSIVFVMLSFTPNPRNQTHVCLPWLGSHGGPSGFSVFLVPLLVESSNASSSENTQV